MTDRTVLVGSRTRRERPGRCDGRPLRWAVDEAARPDAPLTICCVVAPVAVICRSLPSAGAPTCSPWPLSRSGPPGGGRGRGLRTGRRSLVPDRRDRQA